MASWLKKQLANNKSKLQRQVHYVLLATNLTCTEKPKSLVIGISKHPLCFKNVKTLPIDFRMNCKAWMIYAIFEAELRKWDGELRKQKRKLLQLFDNCSVHPKLEKLGNINLFFFSFYREEH